MVPAPMTATTVCAGRGRCSDALVMAPMLPTTENWRSNPARFTRLPVSNWAGFDRQLRGAGGQRARAADCAASEVSAALVDSLCTVIRRGCSETIERLPVANGSVSTERSIRVASGFS